MDGGASHAEDAGGRVRATCAPCCARLELSQRGRGRDGRRPARLRDRLVEAALEGARARGTVTARTRGGNFPRSSNRFGQPRRGRARPCSIRARFACAPDEGTYRPSSASAPRQLRRDSSHTGTQARNPTARSPLPWYDIGTRKSSTRRIRSASSPLRPRVGAERGVKMTLSSSRRWDDTSSLWTSTPFPRGSHAPEAAHVAGAPGVGMSRGAATTRQGGASKYGRPKGSSQDDGGCGPGLRFRGRVLRALRESAADDHATASTIQIDGSATPTGLPRKPLDSDFDAASPRARDAREPARPLRQPTVGTYPSPFWLRYGDSICAAARIRLAGTGQTASSGSPTATPRLQDGAAGAALPLNRMLQAHLRRRMSGRKQRSSTATARRNVPRSSHTSGRATPPGDVRHAFAAQGGGRTCSPRPRAGRGQRRRSWTRTGRRRPREARRLRLGLLRRARDTRLRNHSDRAQEFTLDAARAFEMPAGAARAYAAADPWRRRGGPRRRPLGAGRPHNSGSPVEVRRRSPARALGAHTRGGFRNETRTSNCRPRPLSSACYGPRRPGRASSPAAPAQPDAEPHRTAAEATRPRMCVPSRRAQPAAAQTSRPASRASPSLYTAIRAAPGRR